MCGLFSVRVRWRSDLSQVNSQKQTVVEFEDISLFSGNRTILKHFSLDLFHGDRVVLNGPSGIGKTSILNLLLGFRLPSEGRIRFCNLEVNADNIDWIRSQIAWVPHNPGGRGRVDRFIGNILGFRRNRNLRLPDEEILRRGEELFLKPEIFRRNMEEISGGERQRIYLLLALLLDRPVLLLDEPTSALDQKSRKRVAKSFLSDEGKTVLSISHDRDWISRCSKKIRIG